MANETANYKLITDVVNDDFVQPEHNNRVANTLDRTLGIFLRRVITAGVFDGWEVTTAKQVDPGEGLIAACWCTTVAEQDVDDLTNGAVNYVFAEVTDTSGADGSVGFRAQTSGSGPSGSVLLGTIELDGGGAVVEVDNNAAGVQRQCYPIAWCALAGGGTVAGVPAGEQVVFTVSHDALRVPGAITFDIAGSDFTWEIDRTYEAASFCVTAVNESVEAADLVYTWDRQGVAE